MSSPLPKPYRQTDPGYLDFVRLHRCVVWPGCRRRGEAHHLTTRGAGGGDYSAVPLCREHHAQIHNVGRSQFEDAHNLNLWEQAANLLGIYLEGIRREQT